jgi:hypothetical protein
MTTYFVSNAGSNTAPYDTEAKAATTLGVIAALPWLATDIVKISSTHTETAAAAITYSFPATQGLQLLSVLFNGSGTGALTAGAAINIGAASATFTIGNGYVYGYGITFVGTTNNAANTILVGNTAGTPAAHKWVGCTFSMPSINTGAVLVIGPAGGSTNDDIRFDLVNCTVSNGAIRSISIRSGVINISGLVLAGTAPTSVFSLLNGSPCLVNVDASDLSGVAWTNFVNVGVATYGYVRAFQCKCPASFVVSTGSFAGPGQMFVEMIDCNNGDVNTFYAKDCWEGTIRADTTKYADASDGTNFISWLMTTSANASFTWPLASPPIVAFNSTLSALTTTVHVAHNAVGGGTGGKLLNSECWQETLAKITSGSPLGTWNRADRVADILTAGADQDTDATTSWTGAAIATHDNLISGSFTPAEIGPITTVVNLAKPSVAVYVSPKMVIA